MLIIVLKFLSMKHILSSRYMFFITLILTSFYSCKEKEETVVPDPSNLIVEVIISETEPGKVNVQATADNTIEFRFYIDSNEEALESNSTGIFEYIFTDEGVHTVSVRAYGETGRYIKVEKEVTIGNNEIPLDKGYSTPLSYSGMQLVWNDEFEGTIINLSNWSFETGAGGWGNNELQYYRKENAWISDGALTIEARKENYQNSSYTSTRMITRNKHSFKYGRIDIRALLPKGQGIWPALWMLGNNLSTVGWPKSGELDIMEMIGGNGREKTVHGTLHWDNNNQHAQAGGSYNLASGTFGDEYHVFSIIWDETAIRWFVNDTQFHVIDITPAHMTEFHQEFFFIFNIAVGGNWPGYPNATTQFPQQMKVDYIRVFQPS